MSQPGFEEQLKILWEQNARDFALAFFREAIHSQLTLTELESVLACDTVKGQLEHISLGDVLGAPLTSTAPPAVVEEVPPPPPAARPRGAGRRPRQSLEKMQHAVVRALQESRDGMTTPAIAERLVEEIPDVDPARTIAVLRHLETGGQVFGDRSRPRRWQLKNVGRKVPEPIIIRKAAVVEAEAAQAAAAAEAPKMQAGKPAAVAAVPAVNGEGNTPLLSQSEIRAAAQALHERFFASSKNS